MDDLFNIVMAALAKPRKGIWNYQPHKFSDLSRRRVQQGLIGSQKFTVCDSLLEHCVVASLSKPKVLLDMCELAIPCFKNMWIEWDERKRMEMFRHHSTKMKLLPENFEWKPEDWGERVGYHIWDDPQTTCFHYSQFTLDGKTGEVLVPPMAIAMENKKMFDHKSNIMEASSYGVLKEGDLTKELRSQQLQISPILLGTFYADRHGGHHLEQLMYRMCPSLHNAGNMVLPKKIQPEKHAEMAKHSAVSCAGDMRFLIATLAMLNYPHTVKERKTEAGVSRFKFGRSVPRNELRIVEIDLPKPRGTTRYERMFKGGGGKKRRHVRRGHMHTFIYRGGERKVKWVEEKRVGDASLGTITHDYELKSKQSR
tara:strand:+ start:951 stop:2054 length:1104 start_codon:yes stop_codon:yes gene_type:complete